MKRNNSFYFCQTGLRSNDRAFSLIELILGMMIVSILGVGLFSTFTNGLRLNREIESASRLTRELRWVFDGFSQDFENACGYNFIQSYPKQTPFNGESNRVQFLTATDEGLKWVSYFIGEPKRTVIRKTIIGKRSSKNTTITTRVSQEARKFLIREVASFADGINPESAKDVQQEIILKNVREDALKFKFGSAQEMISWEDSWQKPDLPSFVKVELNLDGPQGKSETETVISRQFFLPMGEMGRENQESN